MNRKLTALAAAAAALAALSMPAWGAPGDSFPWTQQQLVDRSSGRTYNVSINAFEGPDAGVGGIGLNVNGPGLWLTTVHGVPSSMQLYEAGMAFSQPVTISAQALEFIAHGHTHSDAPNRFIFIGPVTITGRYERNSGQIRIVIQAPRGDIMLEGKLGN